MSTGPSGPSAGMPNVDPISGALGVMNLQSMSEDIKAKKYANRLKKIEVENAEEGDTESNTERSYVDPNTGAAILPEELDKWQEDHPGLSPELVVTKTKGAAGKRAAQRDKAAFVADMCSQKQRIDDYETRSVANLLERAVKKGQFNDPRILAAMSQLPASDKRRIDAMADQLESDKELKDSLKEYQDQKHQNLTYQGHPAKRLY